MEVEAKAGGPLGNLLWGMILGGGEHHTVPPVSPEHYIEGNRVFSTQAETQRYPGRNS
jgi:hypothetical protein